MLVKVTEGLCNNSQAEIGADYQLQNITLLNNNISNKAENCIINPFINNNEIIKPIVTKFRSKT